MMDFESDNQLKDKASFSRSIAALLLVLTVAACSGGQDADQANKEAQANKQSERASLANKLNKKNLDEKSSTQVDSVAQVIQTIEPRNETSDDLVTELEDEAAAEEYDEYASVEPYEGSTVKLLERSEGYIEWQAPSDIAYKQADIVIVDESGERVNYTFSADEAMVLDSSLPDGLYKWESVVTPEVDPYVMDQMRTARASGDLRAQKEMKQKLHDEGSWPDGFGSKENRQSGAFVVRGGVVTPTTSTSDGQDE